MIKCQNACPDFDGCCVECPNLQGCKSSEESCLLSPLECGSSVMEDVSEETGLTVFYHGQGAVVRQIAELIQQRKQLEAQEDKLKEQLKAAMELCNIKKYSNDVLSITYVAATTQTKVNSARLKKEYPDIYDECSKTAPVSAYVKVAVKDK